MFSERQKNVIFKMGMLVFGFTAFVSISFNVVFIHQYAHAVNMLIEHMRVIHNAEITAKELKKYISKEENKNLNFTKEIRAILENRENNKRVKE